MSGKSNFSDSEILEFFSDKNVNLPKCFDLIKKMVDEHKQTEFDLKNQISLMKTNLWNEADYIKIQKDLNVSLKKSEREKNILNDELQQAMNDLRSMRDQVLELNKKLSISESQSKVIKDLTDDKIKLIEELDNQKNELVKNENNRLNFYRYFIDILKDLSDKLLIPHADVNTETHLSYEFRRINEIEDYLKNVYEKVEKLVRLNKIK